MRLAVLLGVVLSSNPGWAAETYDPLRVNDAPLGEPLDLTVHDASRKRDVPIRVYLPQNRAPAAVVLFSHGLGGSREGSRYLGVHWSARGYACVFLQHPGSDVSVWQDKAPAQRMKAMKAAANARNFQARVKDVAAVLDALERWNGTPDHALAGRLNLQRVGMSGHSFGAMTTQAVSGQEFGGGRVSFTECRIRAAVMFSPSSPRRGGVRASFAKVNTPWLLVTGTRDVAAIGDADVPSRLAVYPALPPGGKYELVLHEAEHSAFTDRALPGESGQRNPNHHRAVLALTTAFWDAWLREDPEARRWLDGDGPRSVLENQDRWQRK
jgi:predicted dienelactone hydrolase